MVSRLSIEPSAYRLQRDAGGGPADVAVLAGGAPALLGSALALDELRLESAIAVAEDWLMPHAAALQGQRLEVGDGVGRLRMGMQAVLDDAAPGWSTDALERLFLRMVDLATGRHPPPALREHAAAMADLLLLRELAHHGRLASIVLADETGQVVNLP